jgi:hypothetical protein
MVINFSQGLRDGMNFAGCDEESQFADLAGLVEKSKNTGRDRCANGEQIAMQHEGEARMDGPAIR